MVRGESCPTGSSSVGGLEFYETGGFPDCYDGALFFADYTRDCIWAMPARHRTASRTPPRSQTFNPGAASPVDLEVSPSGELFYANLDGSRSGAPIVYTREPAARRRR